MNDLSARLFEACDRMHSNINEFYEEMHPDGFPSRSLEDTRVLTDELKKYFKLELDLINSLIEEEENYVD